MADAVRSAWLALVGALLDEGPLVLLVDGLQLVDPASVRLLDAALQQYASEPLLVVASAREHEGASLLAIFRSGHPEALVLKPLRDAAALKLVRAVNPELTREAARTVVERAAGNPLRLAEFARLGAQASPESTLGGDRGAPRRRGAGGAPRAARGEHLRRLVSRRGCRRGARR